MIGQNLQEYPSPQGKKPSPSEGQRAGKTVDLRTLLSAALSPGVKDTNLEE